MPASLVKLQCINVSWTSTNWEGGVTIMINTLSQVCQLPESNSGIARDAAKVNILILLDARNA